MKKIIVRNKKVLVELLQDKVDFEKIEIAKGLDQDEQTKKIMQLVKQQGITVEEKKRGQMEKRRSLKTNEAISGVLNIDNSLTMNDLLDKLSKEDKHPFFLFINKVDFAINIGLIARTAFALGVNGIFYQGKEEDFLNNEIFHYSMGAIVRIPLIKVGIFEALKELQKSGVKIYSIQMGDKIYSEVDLTGPVAFVLGEEKEGLSEKISERCDAKLSIPMRKGIDSMNVGVSASIILSEKVRQEGLGFLKAFKK